MDSPNGAVSVWRLITGTLLAILVSVTSIGITMAFSWSQRLTSLERDFVAMHDHDERQWKAIELLMRRLEDRQ